MQQDLINSGGDGDLPMDVYGRSVKGGAWLVGMRVLMGVVSAVRWPILMRLLAPHDFGILGIGTLMMGMVASFSELGFGMALIQRKEHDAAHLNVAWTVGLIRGLVLFILLYLAAPYAAIFFDGSGRFDGADIHNSARLVEKLNLAEDGLSRYLVSNFTDTTRGMLDEYDSEEGVSDRLNSALVDELDKVVTGAVIYDSERFRDVDLSGHALRLIEQSDEDRDNLRFNRRLLDEAYAGIIKQDVLDRRMATLVIQVLAISVLLGGLRNIGTMYFMKELEFSKLVILRTSSEIVTFCITVTLAFMYRSVWALVFGRLGGVAFGCVLSYVMHPYRPKLSFDPAKARELWGFGKHMFSITILKFLCLHGDDFFLGRMLGATVLGFYQQAFKIGNMVATEIGNKVQTVAFPAYSKLQDNVAKLRSGYFKALKTTTLIIFPAAGGLIALGPEITEVVFGEQWLPMVPAMQILCLLGPLKCMQRASVFMAMGRPDIMTKLSALRFVLMAATIYPLTAKWGMAGTSLCVLGGAILLQPIGFYELQKLIGAKVRDIFKILSYPVMATLVMMLCVYLAKNAMAAVGLVSLLALIVLGAGVYLIVILLLSKISPDYDALASVRDITRGLKS